MAAAAVATVRAPCLGRPGSRQPRQPARRAVTPPRQQAASVRRPCGRRRAKDPEQWVDLRQEDEWESEEEEDDDDVGYNPEAHQQLLAAGQGAGQQREVMPDTLGWQLQAFQPLAGACSLFPTETEEGQAPGGGEPGAAPPATREQQQQRLQGVLGMSAQRRQYLQIEPDQQFIPPWHKMRYQMPEAAPQLSEWDLRAKMEKRRRQAVEDREWNERRAQVGRYPQAAADWRSDTRCTSTGNPIDPTYREWTQRELWGLITGQGRNADPRDVELRVFNPLEVADAPAEGSTYTPTPEEWFAAQGRLIADEDVEAIAASAGEKDEEAALLAAEFDDFDEQLVGGGGGVFDDGFGGAAGGAKAAEDDDGPF